MQRLSTFRFIDLFAGAGGFHHALASLGGRCVLACEIDDECRRVYRAAFPELSEAEFPADIRSLTRDSDGSTRSPCQINAAVPDHDVLCAGFPCQPFSKSGAQMGVRDRTRGTLFFDIMEIARAKRPRFMILENVRNLAGPRHRDTWNTIIEAIRDAGYRVSENPLILSPHLIPPEHGGAPQVRDRVFILCEQVAMGESRLGTPPLSRHCYSNSWNPARWRVADLLYRDSQIDRVERFRLPTRALAWVEAWGTLVRDLPSDNLPGFPIWADCLVDSPNIPAGTPVWKVSHLTKNAALYREFRGFFDSWLRARWGANRQTVLEFPRSRTKFEWQARKAHPTSRGRMLEDLVLQFRPSGIRVKPANYLPALVAITQTSVVGPAVAPGIKSFRTITPDEAATLQGIPAATFRRAGVSDRAIYRQLGNAVNVGVVRMVAETLLREGIPDSASEVSSELFVGT